MNQDQQQQQPNIDAMRVINSLRQMLSDAQLEIAKRDAVIEDLAAAFNQQQEAQPMPPPTEEPPVS